MSRLLALVSIAISVAMAGLSIARQSAPKNEKAGSAACAQCHPGIYARWSDTIHGKMIQKASPTAVRGEAAGIAGEPGSKFWRDGHFYIVGDRGKPHQVDYTLGNRRLQHYLSAEANGEILVLPSVWDVRRKEWFHASDIVPGVPRDFVQQWNMTCFFCHVTQQEQDVKGYDPESRRYETKWIESSAACERCHGPRSLHASGATDYGAGERTPKPQWERLMMCGQCHWPKVTIATGYDTTKKYLDYYVPVMVHTDLDNEANPSGWADGRPKRFSNEARAFFLSGCYQSGQAFCTSCHDPHWNRTDGNEELMKRPDQYCRGCHSEYARDSHTHHTAESAGSSCVACHMPKTVEGAKDHMRDHTMLGPVPENTVRYGIPNACSECHADRSPSWAADKVEQWYPNRSPRPRLRALAFSMAKKRDPKAVPPLIQLASDQKENAAIRATAVGYLGWFSTPLAATTLSRFASDREPLVRLETARSLGKVGNAAAAAALAILLNDEYRSVRVQAAAAVVALSFAAGQNVFPKEHPSLEALSRALAEYRQSLEVENDLPDVLLARGFLELFVGRLDAAAKAYRQALRLDKGIADAHVGLALVNVRAGDRKEALKYAKEAFQISGKETHRKLMEQIAAGMQ